MLIACASCTFNADSDFAFCPKCGTRLHAPADAATTASPSNDAATTVAVDAEADRRPVTVLFADLSGFTSLSERLDPEDVRALQTDLFNAMSSTIRRFEGFVEKYVGDAVLAVFGAPAAHEDDPERALHAALAMRARVTGMNTQWQSRLPQPLALHIGINTGAVVAGRIGSTHDAAYAVTGDTVNVAARLQNAAGLGEILVSDSTYRFTQHAFRFESLGPVSLKGKAEPVPVYRLDGAVATYAKTRGLEGIATPLIGRAKELAALTTALDRMLAKRTQLVQIVGEAGAGKSRLLVEFLDTLRAQGRLATILVRQAACSSVGERAYGVPAALLRDAYGLTAEDSPETAQRKIASALSSMGADAHEIRDTSSFLSPVLGLDAYANRVSDIEPQHVKQQISLAVLAAMAMRLQHSALLLIVED
ncbi:MAG: adenylate/guanylate cyclase domain-containing protein, partial [Betaproteobacteria bacterium]